MSELQATVEFSVELYKFYNVDLFQRGFYQVRTVLRVSPKLPVKVEVTLPRTQKSELVFPACVVNGAGVSKTFQILYRNEEVCLDDAIMFRAHILVDSHKIEETLERADFSLSVELWFTDQTFGPEQHSAISCVSSRTLQLKFSPTRGLHYHLPVLFDYFHLAAVTLTIHASLVALHQPYIKKSILHLVQSCTPRSGKTWLGNHPRFNFRQPQSTMETVFFGNLSGSSGTKCVGSGGTRLAHARHVHREVCSLLLAAHEALQTTLQEYTRLLPHWQQLKMETSVPDCFQRLGNLSDLAKDCQRTLLGRPSSKLRTQAHWDRLRLVEGEEEFVTLANSDIAQLCAENILLWQQFLEAFSCKDPVHQHLARTHHHLRVKRFAEAFFVIDNPRGSAAGCYDQNYQSYLAVTEALRRSRYLAGMPNLPVHCAELDGDSSTLPIIFEDQYQEVSEFARRRSVAGRKAGSDPFLNTCGVGEGVEDRKSLLSSSKLQEDCSCGITAILESRSQKAIKQGNRLAAGVSVPMGVGEERLVRGNNGLVEASLTLMPQARHSKSLDQLLRAPTTDLGLPLRSTHALEYNTKRERHKVPIDSATLPTRGSHSANNHVKPENPEFFTLPLPPSHSAKHRNRIPQDSNNILRNLTPIQSRKELINQKLSRIQSGISTLPFTLPSHNSQPHNKRRSIPRSVAVRETIPPMISSRDINLEFYIDPKDHTLKDIVNGTGKYKEEVPVHQRVLKSRNLIENSSNLIVQPTYPERIPHVMNGNGSPSTDSNDSSLPSNYRRLETSASVPYNLSEATNGVANIRHSLSTASVPNALKVGTLKGTAANSSESMPNLITSPPKPFEPVPLHRSPLLLSSSLSESDITSEQSGWVSSHRSSVDTSSGQISPTGSEVANGHSLNSSQLRARLEALVSPPTPVPALSEADQDHSYEEVRLPPPRQFRDTPLPPEPFRDPPAPGPVDNLLYHVYESVRGVGSNRRQTNGHTEDRPQFICGGPTPEETPCECYNEESMHQRLVTPQTDDSTSFQKSKEEFKRQVNFNGLIYSDFPTLASTLPYFHISDEYRIFSPEGLHLVVCVHGLDGNSADLRLVKTYLELGLPGANLEFLMSERNQGDTFSDFDTMTDRLVGEILYHVDACGLNPTKISFVGHSLGNIIIRAAIARPQMKHLLPKLHTFLSLSGPHLGTLYNNSGLVNMGMWFMQKWKKSGSLLQLALRDAADVRQTFLYKLSQRCHLSHFRHLLLCGSSQDRYVPLHSARIELCKAAVKDTCSIGAAYREMVHNILYPIISKPEVTLVRYDVHHALPNTANSLIGRAAHIAVLDSELFIEKFLVVTGLKYFR